ncbi:glycosyltransferase [Aerococcaceae bacterium DSM 111021]|nr:glycosyltransferase [Aerococcaceae bacterium DSM 111021]
MEITFLSGIFTEKMEKEILNKSNGPVQYAANNFQKNIVKGLHDNNVQNVKVISAPFIGSYPKTYKDFHFKGEKSETLLNYPLAIVDFINLWGFRNISRKKKVYNKLSNEQSDEKKILMIYSLHTPFVSAAYDFKKKYPDTEICCIVPDLPQYMMLNKNRNSFYRFFKSIDIKILERKLSSIDSFVFLTENMNEVVNTHNKPYTIVEGIVSDISDQTQKHKEEIKDRKFQIVYTGTLSEKYGILSLVEAVLQLDLKDVVLKICGRGDAEKEIEKLSRKHSNLEYYGQLSNNEARQMQQEANIVVNPRKNIGEYTKYSFPSKNMEYMLTGNPLIAYKLDGIPEEYEKYIHFVDDNTVKALSNKIEQIYNQTEEERNIFAEKAKKYLIEFKNPKITVRKILQLINSHNDERR